MVDFKKAKIIVITEIDHQPLTNTKMYNFVLRIFKGNPEVTRKFLLLEGYTNGELNEVIRKKQSTGYLNI